MEVNHHLDWLDAPASFESRMRWAIDALGYPPASPNCVASFEQWVDTTIVDGLWQGTHDDRAD